MGRYTNLDGTTPDKGFTDILKWQVADRIMGRRREPGPPFVVPRRDNDGTALAKIDAHLTWIGHATFVLRLGGLLVATDPIWSARVGTQPRLSEPGVRLEDAVCHGFDVVTISHDHYDHLDLPTLRRLFRLAPAAIYVVPRGCGAVLAGAGCKSEIRELDWFEATDVRTSLGHVRITLVPAQHWSMRVPWDRNQRLWGGFVYEADDGTAYHAGDTAFSELVFRTIREKIARRIDWAMLPVGAYDPVWFMKPQHMGPEEAVTAFELLEAATFCAMHWGTFRLTDEPTGEPPARTRIAFAERRLGDARLHVYDVGETRSLVRT